MMKNKTTFIQESLIVTGSSEGGSVLDILETDRALYSRMSFNNITIIIRDNNVRPFRDCLFDNCVIITGDTEDCSQIFGGFNILLNCTINGKEIKNLATET